MNQELWFAAIEQIVLENEFNGDAGTKRQAIRVLKTMAHELRKLGADVSDVWAAIDRVERGAALPPPPAAVRVPIRDYVLPGILVVVASILGALLTPWVHTVNIGAIYLLLVVAVAMHYDPGPTVFACLTSIIAYDFFFVPPINAFAMHDLVFVPTFAVILTITLIVSRLAVERRRRPVFARGVLV
jgi:two-component system sensor histidine kinase KdpD